MTVLRQAAWGATVLFNCQFTDENGDPITPTTARIHFRQGKKSVFADLTAQSGEFEYRLDTSVFKPGTVAWAIDASGDGDTKVAEDGQILLTANEARQIAA